MGVQHKTWKFYSNANDKDANSTNKMCLLIMLIRFQYGSGATQHWVDDIYDFYRPGLECVSLPCKQVIIDYLLSGTM